MKTTVSKSDFRDAFRTCGRKDNFSYSGLGLLFDYFEQYEEDAVEEIELDVVAICCEYAEDDAATIADNYRLDTSDIDPEDDDALADMVRDYLEEQTVLIGETDAGAFVYVQF